MDKLSKNSRAYYSSHAKILDAFLVVKPPFKKLPLFFDQYDLILKEEEHLLSFLEGTGLKLSEDAFTEFEWPKREIDITQDMKLKSVSIIEKGAIMNGIQFTLTDGFEDFSSPLIGVMKTSYSRSSKPTSSTLT